MSENNQKIVTDDLLKYATQKILTLISDYIYDETDYTETEIDNMFDASSQEIDYYSSLINDQIESSNRLWSSSKVKEEIAKCILESNAYADGLLTNVSSINLKYVESLPSTGDSSTIYILKSTDTNPDTLNLYNEGAWTTIGNFTISLDDYYTTTQVDSLLNDKANDNEVVKVSDILTDTTGASNSNVLSASATVAELNLKANDDEVVKKTDITTSISATPSNDKVLSEKAIISELANKLSIKDENKIATVTESIDLLDYIMTKCTEEHKRYYFRYYSATNAPFEHGIVFVHNFAKSKHVFVFGGIGFVDVYNIMYDSATEKWTEWRKTASQTDLDKKIDKANIVAEPNELSTDKGVVSAKTYYNGVIKNNNIKCYYVYGVSGLGLTPPVTFKDVWDKIDYNTYFVLDTNSEEITDLPSLYNGTTATITYGLLSIWKFEERTRIEYKRAHTAGTTDGSIWFGDIVGGKCTNLSWYRAYVYKHDDASTTEDGKVVNIPFTDTTKYKTSSSVALNYTVINGICYVSGGIACVSPTTSNTQIFTLPKPKMSYQYCRTFGVSSVITDAGTPIIITVGNSGELNLSYGKAGGEYRCTFSYPIIQA